MKKEREWLYQVGGAYKIVLTVLILLILWELSIRVFEVRDFLLPGPLAIMVEIWKNYPRLFYHSQQTLLEVLIGFGLGVSAGIILSVIIVHLRFLEDTFFPLIAALQVTPKVAIIPYLIILFGFGIWHKVLIAGFMSFFPVVINLTKGLKNIDLSLQKWLCVRRANKREIFWHIRVPNSLADFFAGIKNSINLSITGVVVAEFNASHLGLAYLIKQSSFDTSLMFACMIFLGLMAAILFSLVRFVEKRVIRWFPERIV